MQCAVVRGWHGFGASTGEDGARLHPAVPLAHVLQRTVTGFPLPPESAWKLPLSCRRLVTRGRPIVRAFCAAALAAQQRRMGSGAAIPRGRSVSFRSVSVGPRENVSAIGR